MRELENRAMLRTLAESEERLRTASAAAGFGIHETRTAANESTWSAELARMLGHGTSTMLVPWPGAILAATHPEDRSALAAHVAQISRIPGAYEREWRIVRPDGSVRWLLDRGETRGPINPQTRLAAQVTGIIVDITERKLYEEKILLLMREVNHRAKNMLGLVQAMARQTAAATPTEFVARFSARIQALSATQDLLVQNEWHGIDIRDLVRAHLAVFEDLIGNRIELQGPHVWLTPAAAQGIGLALHELATNAGKYGSLSNATGKVRVTWEQDGQMFCITWQEAGGPPVQKPKKMGFGKTIITYAAETSVEGHSELAFPPAGVHWTLQCRLSSIVEHDAAHAPRHAFDNA
jgi:PAS domain S-box-containing protein